MDYSSLKIDIKTASEAYSESPLRSIGMASEIFRWYGKISDSLKKRACDELLNIGFKRSEIERFILRTRENLARLDRIASDGEFPNDDELMLIATLRISIYDSVEFMKNCAGFNIEDVEEVASIIMSKLSEEDQYQNRMLKQLYRLRKNDPFFEDELYRSLLKLDS